MQVKAVFVAASMLSKMEGETAADRHILDVDDKTRKPKNVIEDKRLVTPTGHYRLNKTMNDI